MGWAYAPSYLVDSDKTVGPHLQVIECAAFPGRGKVIVKGTGDGVGAENGYMYANLAIDLLANEGGKQLRDLLGSRLNLDLTIKRESYDIHFHLPPGEAAKEEHHLGAAFVLAAASMATGVPMDKEVRESKRPGAHQGNQLLIHYSVYTIFFKTAISGELYMHGEALAASRITGLDWGLLAFSGAKRILVPQGNKQAFENGKFGFSAKVQAEAPEWYGFRDI